MFWYYEHRVIPMFIFLNPNKCKINTGDCVIRALSIAMDKDWQDVYTELCAVGYTMCDWGNSNRVWTEYLRSYGYQCEAIPANGGYTIADFAADHPTGDYIVATGTHVVAVRNGRYYDTWDSGQEVPILYFYKPDGR